MPETIRKRWMRNGSQTKGLNHQPIPMKILKQTVLTLAAVLGFALASQATVIVDDTWSSATFTNWNLPTQCPWYYNGSSGNNFLGVETNALILTNYSSVVSGTRYFWTYFTTNAPELTAVYGDGSVTNTVSNTTNSFYGYPVDIDVGQMAKVTLKFVPAGFIMDSLGSKGLRFGLLGYPTNAPAGRAARNTSNISKSGTNVVGYSCEIPLCANLTNNPLFSFRVRTELNTLTDSGDPLGKNSVYTSLGAGPDVSLIPGFQLDQEYTLEFSVGRYPSANVVSANISGPFAGVALTNFSRSYTDTSGSNYHTFDAFLVRVDSAWLVTDFLIFKEFKVETLPLPPFSITSAHAIDSDNFRLIWPSLSGQKYRVESTENLTAPSWTPSGTVTATGNTTTWTNTGISGINSRFYRVVNAP